MRPYLFRRHRRSQTLVLRIAILLGSLLSLDHAAALDNGLVKTPPMGWNSWNAFAGTIDETKIRQIADVMVQSGMRDAGYVYLNLDDNWMANPARDSSGNLRGDPTRFPSGMKALGDYIHANGLKFGIYGDRGTMTCMNVPQSGSYGHEQADAKMFASWGVDYFKNDNCNPVGDIQADYQNMQKALASSGRDIVYSICHPNGYSDWMQSTGNLWRISGDIVDKWDNGTNFYKGIVNLIDANAGLASHAKPGAWNDPDMLEIGNSGCTAEEYRSQMSMWSIMAAGPEAPAEPAPAAVEPTAAPAGPEAPVEATTPAAERAPAAAEPTALVKSTALAQPPVARLVRGRALVAGRPVTSAASSATPDWAQAPGVVVVLDPSIRARHFRSLSRLSGSGCGVVVAFVTAEGR